MEFEKKRKIEENDESNSTSPPFIASEDIHTILSHFTQDKLIDIVHFAALNHGDVLDAVRSVANSDSTLRKLFVRGLGGDTTKEALHHAFSAFGPIDEAVIIFDKVTGKSKGYGFVTFKLVDGAVLALKEPSKKINGRMTFVQLAYLGVSRNENLVRARKIFIGHVSFDISADRLLSYFESYGEVEEGPLGFERVDGKTKGFAFIVYKTKNSAREALVEPIKVIDGHQVHCRLAVQSKKVKPVTPTQAFLRDSHHHYQHQHLSSLHAPPMVSSQYHAPLLGWSPPNPADPFREGFGLQQPVSTPGLPPQEMFQGMSPYYGGL